MTAELLSEGVDVIKIMATGGNMTIGSDPFNPAFKTDEVNAIVEAAHAAGIRVTAHARGVAGIKQVAEAGVDSVEHCRMEIPPGVWGFDESVARTMAERGITAAPTMAASHRAAELHARGGEVALRPGGIPTGIRQQNAARLRECGVSVVVGTDAGAALATFDEATHVEMELLVGAGWSPLDALRAGTLGAAAAIGLDREIGSIEAGKAADLVIVEGDPSQDVTQARRVVCVIQDGKTAVDGGHLLADGNRFARGRLCR
jgi:imidazolonepropionase-like amidohydrolase